MSAILAIAGLMLLGCHPAPEPDCLPDASGCYCPNNATDVATCETLDAGLTAFCCIGHGGTVIDCGQPAGCQPRPGLGQPDASGANWCCPEVP